MPSPPMTEVHELGPPRPARFVVPFLNEEIRAIGGSYTYLSAVMLPVCGRSLLYLVGAALVDTSCCGVGGCGFALVAGWMAQEGRQDADTQQAEGSPSSSPPRGDHPGEGAPPTEDLAHRGEEAAMVLPITDPEQRSMLTRLIHEEEKVQEVRFWTPEEVTP